MDQYKIASISFDCWNASTLVSQLSGEGVMMVPIGMGYASQSAPLRELERMVLERQLIHEVDPVLRWMVRNVMIARDPAGNQKLDKARSGDKIDGVMALNCAVAEWMTRTASDPDEIPDDPTIKLMRKLSTREGFIDEVYKRLPAHRTMVDAYWDVEYDYTSSIGTGTAVTTVSRRC